MALLESQRWNYLGWEEGQKLKSFTTETTCRQLAEKKCGESRQQRNTKETVRVSLPSSSCVKSHLCHARVSAPFNTATMTGSELPQSQSTSPCGSGQSHAPAASSVPGCLPPAVQWVRRTRDNCEKWDSQVWFLSSNAVSLFTVRLAQ